MKRLLLAVLACACREQPEPTPTIEVASYAAVPSTKLDVLFQIDNSASVSDLQVTLASAFPLLLDRIGDLDLHIGVVTSDLGTSATTGDPAPMIGSPGQGGCVDHGDDGVLQTTGAPVTDPYIVDENDGLGGRRTNYTGDIATVLGQMVRVGSGGCGFEQPLAATKRALVNNANTGFTRNDANLLVVMLMDEDDCSVRDPALFGPASEALGPQSSFRCTQFGLECDQPIDEVGEKTNCHPRADSPYVDDIAPFVDAMRTVRGDPARVAVTAIAGPPIVSIEERVGPGGGAPELALVHSCASLPETGVNAAAPAVRIAAVVDELAPNSAFEPVCNADFSSAVANVARVADGLRGIICLDPARVGTEPACSVTLESLDGETQLSLCPAAGDCFEIVDDVEACGDRPRLLVHLASPTADQYVRARCELR